jgi:hypothetical protein
MTLTFDDLKVRHYEFEIEGPDGELLGVKLRAPTPYEVIEVNRASPRPRPPVSDIRKEGEKFYNIYDYEDGSYRIALEEWVANTRRMMIAHLLVEPLPPGDTIQDKADALKDVAAWALVGLHQATEMLLGSTEDRVRMRKFRGNGMDVAEDIGAPGVE